MIIDHKIYHALLSEVPAYSDPADYASDFALSSIWGEDAPEPAELHPLLVRLHEVARMDIRQLASAAGISMRRLALRFGIPTRTVECWAAPEGSPNHRDCPPYVLLLIAECLGLMPFEVRL